MDVDYSTNSEAKGGRSSKTFLKSQTRKFADFIFLDLRTLHNFGNSRIWDNIFCDLWICDLWTQLFFAKLKLPQKHDFYFYLFLSDNISPFPRHRRCRYIKYSDFQRSNVPQTPFKQSRVRIWPGVGHLPWRCPWRHLSDEKKQTNPQQFDQWHRIN